MPLIESFGSATIYLSVATLLIGYYTYKWFIYPFYLSPMCKIPGPPPDNFLLGNFFSVLNAGDGSDHTKWVEKYGDVYKYYGFLNDPMLGIADGKLLQQVLVSEAYSKFGKPKNFLGIMSKLFGDSILMADGEVHKKQRKMMIPTFNHSSVKNMVPTIVKICNTMKDLWKKEIKKVQNVNNDKKGVKIEVGDYFTKFTLDVIGAVGFGYEFNTLTSKSILADSFESLFSPRNQAMMIYRLLANAFPILRVLPLKVKKDIDDTTMVIENTTKKLVQDKLDKFQKGELKSNDLISNLIKVNYGQEIDEDERMSLEEIRSQIMTSLIAGHETTSVALSWTLYYLSKNQNIQNKLREEIIKEFPDKDFMPTFDQVHSLEYLNAVCKETLRIAPPVTLTSRAAKQDVIINGYLVPKNTRITIPIYTIHHLASIWGDDVEEYNPSRWFTEKVKNLSNYYFLPFIAGPRSCMGSKLAMTEMKICLAILIRNFQFNEIEGFKVSPKFNISFRPDPSVKFWVNEIN